MLIFILDNCSAILNHFGVKFVKKAASFISVNKRQVFIKNLPVKKPVRTLISVLSRNSSNKKYN
jgi:hypothetical protein